VITPVGDILLVEKDKVSVSINVSDPEGDPLNISISPLESWMSLNGRDLVLKPLVGDAGSYALTLTVSDGQNSATEIINVIVEPIPNNAPVLNITNYKKVIVEKGQKSVKFSIDFDVSDPDGDRVRTSVNDLPRFAKLKRSSIDFTVSDKNVGIYNFSVTATDALGAATTEDVTVEVVLAAKNSKVTLSNTITVLQKWQSLDKRQKKEAVNNLVKQLKRNLRKK